jgi:tetratricopeptide (TPR) repeat protein
MSILGVSRSLSLPAVAFSATVLGLFAAAPAVADEIRYADAQTCEPTVEQVAEIQDESWTQVSYRVRAGQPLKRLDTRLLIDIRRSDSDTQSNLFRSALAEFQSANWGAARQAFGTVAGGGRTQDAATGTIEYRPFPAVEAGKTKWYVAYAHYYYAASSLEEGLQKGEAALIEDALRAVDADKADEKGFLARYKEGKSRFYADAWLVKAKALVALKKYDEAAAAFDGLYQKSLTTPIGVRFSYEAKVGAGLIAEAKGDPKAAETAYEGAAAALQSLFDQPQDACGKREIGRWFNEARIQKARVMLAEAEKAASPAEFARMRAFLVQGTPEALRTRLAGKPADVIDAVLGGALAPSVQAVTQNGLGVAALSDKKYAEAVVAFNNVRIKYFQVRSEVPRALRYLAKAADQAAAAATKPDAKSLYSDQAAAARAELERWK